MRLKNARQGEDGRELLGVGALGQLLLEAGHDGGGVLHRLGHDDAEGRVDEEHARAERRIIGHAVEARGGKIEVPEEAHAGLGIGQAALAAIGRIDADAKEGRVAVIEQVALFQSGLQGVHGRVQPGRAKEHEHQPAARRHVQAVVGDGVGGAGEGPRGLAEIWSLHGGAFRIRKGSACHEEPN